MLYIATFLPHYINNNICQKLVLRSYSEAVWRKVGGMHFIQIASVLVAFVVGQFLYVLALVPVGLVSISLILGFSAWTKPGWPETFWGVVIVIVCLTFGYLFGALADFFEPLPRDQNRHS
jgi:uncharacterized membrane protein